MKTVAIDDDRHKALRIFAANNDLQISDVLKDAIDNHIDYSDDNLSTDSDK